MRINKEGSIESEQSLTQNEQSQFFNSLLKVSNKETLSAEEESNVDKCLQKLNLLENLITIDPAYKLELGNRFSKDKSSSNWTFVNKPSFFWGIILGIIITTFSTGMLSTDDVFHEISKYPGFKEAFFSWFFYFLTILGAVFPILLILFNYCIGRILAIIQFLCSPFIFIYFQTLIDKGESLVGGSPPIYTFFISILLTIIYYIILNYSVRLNQKKD